jgi:hypothetical protein
LQQTAQPTGSGVQTAIQIVQPPAGQVQTVSVASPAVEQVVAFHAPIPDEFRILVVILQSMNRFLYFEFLSSPLQYTFM